MPFVRLIAAPGRAGALYYVPAWKARRMDLPDGPGVRWSKIRL
jgi:hypothetical protein